MTATPGAETTKTPMYDSDGRLIGVLVGHITERKLAEERSHSDEERPRIWRRCCA